MANLKQAPRLYHNGNKKEGLFYQLPQELIDIVFNELDGKSGNQIKLMCVLLGTVGNGSFGVSEKWICERTGMIQQTYNRARKALIEKGWLRLENGKIFVEIDYIYSQGTLSKCGTSEDKKDNFIMAQYEDMPKGITSKLKTQYEDVPPPQYENVYNIKEINKSNIKSNKKALEKNLKQYEGISIVEDIDCFIRRL